MPFSYYRPKTLDEAWRRREEQPDSRFVAGGTDLLVRIRRREIRRPEALVSLRSIPELHGIEEGDRFRIGAATALADGTCHPGLARAFPALVQAARSIGSVQIRSVGTFGGNLSNASPCADLTAPLLAYEADLEIRSARGTRRVPITDFFLRPGKSCLDRGEVLAAILLDVPPPGTRAFYVRRGRVGMDLAQASVAVRLEPDGDRCRRVRVAAGAVAPTPVRLPGVEAMLEGAVVTESLLARVEKEAAAAVAPISDIRATAEHRRRLVGVFVRRTVERLTRWQGR